MEIVFTSDADKRLEICETCPEYRPNLSRFHAEKERELNKATQFTELWPEYAN